MKTLSKTQLNAIVEKFRQEAVDKISAASRAVHEIKLDEIEAVIEAFPNADVIKRLITGTADTDWRGYYTPNKRSTSALMTSLGGKFSVTTQAKEEALKLMPNPRYDVLMREAVLATIDATSIDDIMAILSAKFE